VPTGPNRFGQSIRVDPVFDALYQGYYILGIRQTVGGRLSYATPGFPTGHHCLAFIVEPDGWKICIDTQDRASLFPAGIMWCDVYGKVNVDPTLEYDPRVVPIGPSFGLRVWSLAPAALRAARNHSIAGARVTNPREFYANFYRQWRYRLPLSMYKHVEPDPGFVFFLASLWADDPICNQYRATFLRICRSSSALNVEGGFAPRQRGEVPGFDDLTLQRRYSLRHYLDGVQRSLFVFNTPAVFGCLGWKLGEYFAVGKAVISLPLNRELPAPLEHGRHIHFVDGSPESLRDAVDRLAADAPYRRALEAGAIDYFDRYLRPDRTIAGLLDVAASR
jgi:hypothetical protein